MIGTALGEVTLSQPDYELAKRMGLTKDQANEAHEIIYEADLHCIFSVLVDTMGLDETLKVWTRVAESEVEENLDNA